jgi:hypothetical protein
MTQLIKQLQLGVSDSAVEKWEKNQNFPAPDHLAVIVSFLGFEP